MAQSITINIDDALEVRLLRVTQAWNAERATEAGFVPKTPAQVLRVNAREWIEQYDDRLIDVERLGLRAPYKAAPSDVQAAVDALLAPYR